MNILLINKTGTYLHKPRFYQGLVFILTLLFLNTSLYATVSTYTSGGTAQELADKIAGPGLTISNPVIRRGSTSQTARFDNGTADANLAVDSGILLTTMSADEAFSTNNSGSYTINNPDITPDNDLTAIDNRALYDTVVFEFDVVLDENTRLILVNYQFASEEYNEYVGSIFNDAFGFFISGGDLNQTYNIARVRDPNAFVTISNLTNFPPVTVNNVNNGTPGANSSGEPSDYTNAIYFIDNEGKTDPDVEFDGLTVGLNATLDNLTPGITYHFKMALSDVGDSALDTGVFVNTIRGVRVPKICYDYSYKQNDRFFSEDYNKTLGPVLSGTVVPGDPIEISVAIQSIEESDVSASNVKFNVLDMNISQITYWDDTVYVADPGIITRRFIADNTEGMTNTSSSISDIPIANFQNKEFFYTYYSVRPSVDKLNTPLDLNVTYTMTIPLSPTQSFDINVTSVIDIDTPICSSGGISYRPEWGIFNIVDRALYDSTNPKYNLFSQVTNRPFDVDLIATDVNNTTIEQAVQTVVGVQMIDVGGYQDINSSCWDPDRGITSIQVQSIGDATNSASRVTLSVTDPDFYNVSRENTAFRIWYLTGGADHGLFEFTTQGELETELASMVNQAGITCIQTVGGPTGAPCAANPSDPITASCFECLRAIYGVAICSRDNFSIRPETFNIQIQDTTAAGSLSVPTQANLSAGYEYSFDINATTHIDDKAAPGYSQYFFEEPETSLQFLWEPTATTVVSGCNDTNDSFVPANLAAGTVVNMRRLHNNVGLYRLHMVDTTWTDADKLPEHHALSPNYFVDGDGNGNDCVQSSNDVPLYVSGDYITSMVGCNIESKHFNNNTNKQYNDHNLTFRPHHFGVSSIQYGVGDDYTALPIPTPSTIKLYSNDVDNNQSMGIRFFGQIRAEGENNVTLNNFVNNCYASNVNIDLNQTINSPIAALPTLKYHLEEHNVNNISIVTNEVNGSVINNITGVNVNALTLNQSSFIPNALGALDMNLTFNYNRVVNAPSNPINVTLHGLQVLCQTGTDCDSIANNNLLHQPDNEVLVNSSITSYYARVHIPRYRINGDGAGVSGNVTMYYEVYCDQDPTLVNTCNPALHPTVLPGQLLSPDSVRWFQSENHTIDDGQVYSFNIRNPALINNFLDASVVNLTTAHFQYDGLQGYPFKTTIIINASPWLIYHRFDIGATFNLFELEFTSTGAWAGKDNSLKQIDSNIAPVTNRRIQW